MTDNLPNYAAMEPPEDTPVDQYSTHERRAEILHRIKEAGSPFAITQVRLAERYGVHESTISRDMDRLRESIDDHLGNDAKLLTRTLLEKTVQELQAEGEWKAAWDVVMDWNEWLADLGEQHREPDRVEADVRQRTSEVQYRVVREEPDDVPVGGENGGVDYAALGFTAAPGGEVDVEAVDAIEDEEVSEADE
jgi:DNA-binding Lrp family transcriptional regulator